MATALDLHVPTSEVNENYVNSSVMFPIGNTYARGKFIGLRIDASGNSVVRRNDNPILDTQEYWEGQKTDGKCNCRVHVCSM